MKGAQTALFFIFATGCAYVSDKTEDERLDPDGDGISWPLDCDDNNAEIGQVVWYKDNDGDGFGTSDNSMESCQPNDASWVENNHDCDDDDPNTFPGAAPLDSAEACMSDADQDGWGDSNPSHSGDAGSDCNDSSLFSSMEMN